MIYFKESRIQNSNGKAIEEAIRKTSLKRHTSLDLKVTSTYIDEENQKYFLGLESKNNIKLTRIRGPFERLLPKLIVRFNKNDFETFDIRYGIFSFLFGTFLIISFSLNIIYSIEKFSLDNDIIPVLFLTALFVLLTYLEYRLTVNRIKKAVKIISEKT